MISLRSTRIALLALAAALSPLLASSGPGAQVEDKTVLVEGVGVSDDRAKARDDAIADAQRRAVEVGVGLYVKSESLVRNFVLLSDSIYSHAEGYVASYDILSERHDGDECRVSIRARVRMGNIEDDLAVLWDRLQLAGSPRVIVAVEEAEPTHADALAHNIITEKLVGYGFKVLDPGQLEKASWRRSLRLIQSGDAQTADILALQDAADIIVVGRPTYRALGKAVPELDVYSCEAAVDARAIRVDTGEIISAVRGSAIPTAAFRQDQAVEEAVRAAADDWLRRNLGALMREAVDPTRSYSLAVSRCTLAEAGDLVRALSGVRFVRDAHLRAYDEGTAQVEVRFAGTAQALVAEVERLDSPRLAVRSVSARNLMLRLKR